MPQKPWELFESGKRGVTYPRGFLAAAGRCGLKSQGSDLAMIVADGMTTAAAVTTTNLVRAHSIIHSERVALGGKAKAVVASAGNANACNGSQGWAAAQAMTSTVSECLGCEPHEVFLAQTGVIGQALPVEKVLPILKHLSKQLGAGEEIDLLMARAIMTTDLVPKLASLECKHQSWRDGIRFGGVCKGSGMIAPRLGPPHATMLCFLTTDAHISSEGLQAALEMASGKTFNRITVDSDTSTSDIVTLMASGNSGAQVPNEGPEFEAFVAALTEVCLSLAKQIARDGEGATKLVTVKVTGAESESDAELAARAVAESPLVKTALFGKDPNWGRILAAAGRSGAKFSADQMGVSLAGIPVCAEGNAIDFDRDAAHLALLNKDVEIVIRLGDGPGEAAFYTCDYSYDYIRINAEYHT